jgi:thimet oligopeptidase
MQRFVDRVLRDFRRGGLDLPDAEQEKLRALKTRMSALSIEFSKNLGEENTTFELSKEQLEGLPEDWLRGRPKSSDGEKFVVDLKYPSYFPIVKLCKVPETRALVEKAFNSRCLTANSQILEELIRLRADEAALLGFATSSSFVLDIRMAKTTQAVTQFLEELSVMLDPLADAERAELLELKKKECESRGLVFDNVINPFDFQYYCNQRVERKFEVDNEAIKRYFPLQVVTRGLLDIYQRLLGLQFAEVAAPHVWHEEVQMFEVKDTASGDLVGYFYLDLFPRAGKFGHAACFGLQVLYHRLIRLFFVFCFLFFVFCFLFFVFCFLFFVFCFLFFVFCFLFLFFSFSLID